MRTRLMFGAFGILLVSWLAVDGVSWALGEESKFVIPHIKYKGGHYKPRPQGLESLMIQVAKRTSVDVKRANLEMSLNDPEIFRYPFLYLAGDRAFDPFSDSELDNLRNFLNSGGFLLVDDNSGEANSRFDQSVRRMLSQLYPHNPLQKISRDHSIFRSFYLLNRVTGRVKIKPYLEGISLRGRTVLVYSSNDLAGAWSRSKLGNWEYDMVGGGRRQRTLAVRLGVNIVMYALTLDYKKDMVHLPIILERLRRYNAN